MCALNHPPYALNHPPCALIESDESMRKYPPVLPHAEVVIGGSEEILAVLQRLFRYPGGYRRIDCRKIKGGHALFLLVRK
jgi:hypothetical protein